MVKTPRLETERLILREVHEDDVDAMKNCLKILIKKRIDERIANVNCIGYFLLILMFLLIPCNKI